MSSGMHPDLHTYHDEHPTDRIYREDPELLGFGEEDGSSGSHPSGGNKGPDPGGDGGCGCILVVIFVILGIMILQMGSPMAGVTIYVQLLLIAIVFYYLVFKR